MNDRAVGTPAVSATLLLWLVPALWSSNYIVARLADGVILPHALATGRWVLAALLLLPWVGPGLWARRAVVRREARQLLVLGVLGMVICGAWLYQGARSTTAANIALIYAATPLTIALASARLLHERVRPTQWLGMALALAGLLLIITKGRPDKLLAVRVSTGDLWILACAVAWTAYSVLLQHWRSELGPRERLVAIIAGGLLVLLPATLAEAWYAPALVTPGRGGMAAVLIAVVAVLPGVLSYSAHARLQRELGASKTALMLYLSPVYGALLGWLILGEAPGWHHLAGAALILPSIGLAARR